MEKFIREHLERMNVIIHCGGTDTYTGKIMPNPRDGIVILETEKDKYTYISTDKIVAISHVK